MGTLKVVSSEQRLFKPESSNSITIMRLGENKRATEIDLNGININSSQSDAKFAVNHEKNLFA